MNAIKSIRVNIFGMTQVEFASASRVTQPTVHRWEKDARAHPSLENLVAIREAAIERGVVWNDTWFFVGAPSAATQTQDTPKEP